MLREHGVVLAGPPPRTLIDPVPPSELREAVLGILREWWMRSRDAPPDLNETLACIRYTCEYGDHV
jgi:hypothetical protein